MEMTRTIKLIIESRIENVALIGGAVRGISRAFSIDEINSYQLELCAVEAITNVMEHAYFFVAGNYMEMTICLFPDRITFEVCDRGKSFDPAKIPQLEFDPQKRDALPESGMGLFIINSFMDEVSYETTDGINTMTMSKYLRTKEESV